MISNEIKYFEEIQSTSKFLYHELRSFWYHSKYVTEELHNMFHLQCCHVCVFHTVHIQHPKVYARMVCAKLICVHKVEQFLFRLEIKFEIRIIINENLYTIPRLTRVKYFKFIKLLEQYSKVSNVSKYHLT